MWDSIPAEQTGNLLLRCAQGMVGRLLHQSNLKWFTITTVSIINSMQPFFTLVLGYFILKEAVTKTDFALIFIGFLAIVLIVSGMKPDDNSGK